MSNTIEHENLASALVAALQQLTVVDTNRTANAGSYSYKYASIEDAVKLTRPVLAQHGLVALTPIVAHGNELACAVILLHTSGEKLEFPPFPFPHGRDAQATGSMVTYHRRYALIAALGMAAGEDDDGAAAQPRQTQQHATPAAFNHARFTRECGEAGIDPADVLAHAAIDKPLEELTAADRPALLASFKALKDAAGGVEEPAKDSAA